MPYGVKRGVKPAGEYGFTDMIGLAFAGSAGILAALVTDYQQSGEASALYTINQWVVSAGRILGFGDVPLWAVVAGLIAAGAGSIFYFKPITRQGAFAQGFGLLAVLMTAVPADLAGGLEPAGDDLPGLEPVAMMQEVSYGGGVAPAAYTAGEARVYQAQQRTGAKYEVHLAINFTSGIPDDIDDMIRKGTIRGRLHNADTGSTYNLFRNAGGRLQRSGNTLYISAGVPARSDTATLWVRIECEQYAIEEQSTRVSLGGPLNWNIDMRPSSTPLFIQRLGKSYWF